MKGNMNRFLDLEIPVTLTVDDIVRAVRYDGDENFIFHLIVELDNAMASVDFTERLRDYFVEEMLEEEVGEE